MAPHRRANSGVFSFGCQETSRVTGSISYSMIVWLANAKVSAGKRKAERSSAEGALPAAQPTTSQRTGSILWKTPPRLPRMRLSRPFHLRRALRVANHGGRCELRPPSFHARRGVRATAAPKDAGDRAG